MKRSFFGLVLCVLCLASLGTPMVKANDQNPYIYKVSPTEFTNDADTSVTVFGNNFTTVTSVFLDDFEVSFSLGSKQELDGQSWDTILLNIPSGLVPAQYDVTLTNGSGSTVSKNALTIEPGSESILTKGPYGGSVTQLMNDPASKQGIYALTNRVGLFHSADNGEHWNFLFSGTGGGNFAIDAVDSKTLYVNKYQVGLYRSRDSGATWTAIPLSTSFTQLYAVRAFTHPTTTGTVFATIDFGNQANECQNACGIYRSKNFGDTWTRVSSDIPSTEKMMAIAFFPGDPDVIYAGADDGKVFRSGDGGDSWTEINDMLTHVENLVFKPDGILFIIGSGSGVSGPTLRCHQVTSGSTVSLDCLNGSDQPDYVLVDTSAGAFDGPNNITDIKIDPSDADILLAAGGSYIARSKDGGETWASYTNETSPTQPLSVLYNLDDSSIIYAGNSEGFWETDQAMPVDYSQATWEEKDDQLAAVISSYIHTAPSNPLVVYANSSSGLYRTENGGATWKKMPIFCEDDFCYQLNMPFAIDPNNENYLVVAAWNYTMHISLDGGETWQVISGIPKPDGLPKLVSDEEYVIDLHDLIAIPGTPVTYLAGGAFHDPDNENYKEYAGGGIYKSVDSGQTWTIQYQSDALSIQVFAYDPTDINRVYASYCTLDADGDCSGDGILYSSDAGTTWNSLTDGNATFPESNGIQSLAVRQTDGRLYAAYGSGVTWLDKGSTTWDTESGGVSVSEPIEQIVFDPSPTKSSRFIYAATSEGLFVSDDAGVTFVRFDGKLGISDITSMTAAKNTAGQSFIFIATAGGQVFNNVTTNSKSVISFSENTIAQAGVYRIYEENHPIYIPFIKR